ncbi:helix-turn-helix domain-containing protein [Streptomyces sp. NPDC057565]|uniref:PucR family transcriptional regulator n=1 Tax=Streptomyces TaxID=1883 RepID=UPI0033899666
MLGRLLEYESSHRGELLPTLESFVDNQRSWQKTAGALHVHRQTVLYRIRMVEDIRPGRARPGTGRPLPRGSGPLRQR